jgi:hypothetical protein
VVRALPMIDQSPRQRPDVERDARPALDRRGPHPGRRVAPVDREQHGRVDGPDEVGARSGDHPAGVERVRQRRRRRRGEQHGAGRGEPERVERRVADEFAQHPRVGRVVRTIVNGCTSANVLSFVVSSCSPRVNRSNGGDHGFAITPRRSSDGRST